MNKTITTNFNHGVGFQGDLPIPFDIILNVSAWVIILTFVFLKIIGIQSNFLLVC